jgi:two-component system, response regulator PdtaR
MMTDPRLGTEEIRKILVVEDQILVRAVIAEALRDAGMRVVEVGNADEAMQHLEAGTPIDFVFTDIELPGSMNGLELVRRLQVRRPDLKLLMTSGRLPARDSIPAGQFVAKPYDIARVVALIRAALGEPPPK